MNARYNGRVGLVLLCLVLAAGSARAQLTGFEVVASTPASGATGVASETTVSFTFSAPLPDSLLEAGLDSLLDLGIGVHPCDQILVGGSSPCEQVAGGTLSEDGRTLSFQVTHLAQTTYTWTIPELVVSESEVALRAFVLQYATGEALGGVTVDGMVMLESAGGEEAFRVAPGETALNGRMELLRTLTRPRVAGREQPVPSLLDPVVQAVHRPALHKRGAATM
ncbi:Ig-like domain-containing protein [Rhodothermus marinus]|nr:Ig-like domain-containing protein [Rhodothermus marinus]